MDKTLQSYLPESLNQNFTIITKYNSISDLKYVQPLEYSGNLGDMQEKFLDLPRDKQQYFIVTEQFAKQLQNKTLSQEDIANVINETKKLLGFTYDSILTEDEAYQQRKNEEEKLAEQLGLTKKPLDPVIAFLPNKEEPDSYFSIIGKRKNNSNLNQISIIDDDSLSLSSANKMCSILEKQNNGDWDYFVVTSKFAQQIQSLPDTTILQTINKSQEILGNGKKLEIISAPVVSMPEKKIAPPKLEEILAKNEVEVSAPKQTTQATVPTPEVIHNNYKPLSETLKMFASEKDNAKIKKTPMSKKLVFTTVGLLGVGMLSMSLSPIAIPVAFVTGTIAIGKYIFGRGDKEAIKLWTKREKLLKQAALEHLGGEFNSKANIKGIEKIALDPEIEKTYKELCKKANISAMNLTVEKIRDHSNSDYAKSNTLRKK